jgi:2-polyprenyl-3-methyl-5-hydroxy-6-metoxy-1,4-benzoquinol methylase
VIHQKYSAIIPKAWAAIRFALTNKDRSLMTLSPPKKIGSLDSTYDQVFFKRHEKYRDIYQHLAGLIRRYSPSSASSILDVGCGHCLLLEALQRLFPAAYGIDGST